MGEPKLGPDGHPIPDVQGVVTGYITPIVFKDPKQGIAGAVGVALDANGNPIDQTELLKLLGAEEK